MASINLNNLYKKFPNGFEAVKNVNLTIADKEFIVFVGPSGCGKTTMLRMIAGLEDITEGEVYIGEKLMNRIAPKDRDIAMVFQNYALYPHMTVYKNMAMGLIIRKFPKQEIDKRVREAAKMLSIEQLLDRKPKQLSGGESQRVAMGRAIVREPQAFLMDEPLSNLDAKLREQMRTEISKLYQKLRTTFIYVTHDQIEAMTLGTRIVIMRDGIIQQVDTPQNLYNHPANLFVAGFIGSPQMNFFDVKAVSRGGAIYMELGEYSFPLDTERSVSITKNGYEDKTVVLGIRPKNIFFNGKSQKECTVSAFVELVEQLGSETYLHLRIADKQCIASVDPDLGAEVGDAVGIELDFDKIHIFDKETEMAIYIA